MSLATVLAILGAVNTLMGVIKDTPAVADEVRSLLVKVEPAVDNTGLRQAFDLLKAEVEKL